MKKVFLLSIFSLFTLASCSDDDVTSLGPTSTIVGFPEDQTTYNFLTDVTEAQIDVPVNLISYANETFPSNDVVVSWEVNTAETTAVEGVDFDFVQTSTSTTITQGNSAALIPFKVYPIVFDPADPKQIVLDMTVVDSNNAIIGAQYQKVTIILQGVCPSYLAGEYYINFASGPQDITIEEIGPGQYRASYFPTFASVYWWEFSDVCGDLVITDWQYQSGNAIYGTSTPMPHGVINGDGSLTFSGVNVTGVSWYVNLTWTIYPY
ncbi:hypothetical protein DI487_10725 [Flavobacterium sediminis]|uniref:DUF1735 domain-containing protein n=1 Tax=Flavobacterium sediminis TaxID=2201181 RepID=A0A2U8QVQ4_9FLAO|nr:hypothetical protein [Flavobacterium sediminis]AWM14282.1 hypothetical protein DI487_10725 [Flavobacterium sediminis]